jgi:mannose-6-phosphate isomerase-like protein (cupin superfamily)
MPAQLSSLTTPEDPLWLFVTAARNAFLASDKISNDTWKEVDRDLQGVSIKRSTTNTVSDEGPITVAIVTQSVGVVIPTHRHHESHVLLRVKSGAIQVDREGYSRRIEKDQECLIPKGFSHSVFSLECDDAKVAIYLSAHNKDVLKIDDNRFLATWPEKKTESSSEKMTELEVVRERMSWFLSLQPEYLDAVKHANYRAWFYLLHYDEDQSLQAVDKTGHAGEWSKHSDQLKRIGDDQDKERKFRVGKDLSHSKWYEERQYVPIFVAHREQSKAGRITDYYAYQDADSEWVIKRPTGIDIPDDTPEKEGFSKEGFLRYMKLLTEEFLPETEYLIYMTPPQQPGQSGYVEECQRRPFSSCVIGMTHGTHEFLWALFSYYLLCSSVLQQIRFAVRSDVSKIRYDEERRKTFFKDEFLDALKQSI